MSLKPIFVINSLSETVARKGSTLKLLADQASVVFDENIFDNLDKIVSAGRDSGWVVIEGGDGTAQGIISAFFNEVGQAELMPKFTLLPGGMTNQVAKNIGLKKCSKRGVQALLRQPAHQIQMPMLKVSSADYPSLYGFLFSSGGIPMVTEYTKDKLHSRGIGGSAAVLGGIIKGISGRDESILRPTNVKMKVDDKPLSGPHLGTVVTTLPSLILGLDPFWGDDDGPLRVTYVEGGARRLAGHVASLWMGRKTKDRSADGLYSSCASELKYSYDGPIVLDGETLVMGTEFKVTATQPLTFVS